MIRSLYTAATGMEAQQLNMDVIANNLANVNTTGFKKSRVDFQDLLYQTIKAAGTSQAQGVQIPTGIQVGLGTNPVATQKIFTQGNFQPTDNPLDMVISGDGFFEVLMSNGDLAYTRDGSFKKDSDGRIVNSDGYVLQPDITIPPNATDIFIGEDGTVSAKIAGQQEAENIGQITIAKFVNPAGLQSIGGNLFRPTAASGDANVLAPGTDGSGTIKSRMLEMSNVSVVDEMVNMILAQRAYEVNSKSIQVSDEMLSVANSLKR
ncbi:MAG: flagellar basal-body rod protein FlgG [Armatimonadota bacterium]